MRLILSHLFNDDDDVINAKNIKGYSALHIASSINKPEAIKLLVTHGAEIDQPDTKSGKSPLYIAVQEKNVEATQVLLELGADSNKLTYFRDSPSQLASSSDRRHLLRLISRYDSSHPASPPALGRRNSRRVGDVMIKNTHEQNNFIINESERKSSNSQLFQDQSQMSSVTNESKSESPRRNVIVKNSLNSECATASLSQNIRSINTENPKTIKREPGCTSPSSYPISIEPVLSTETETSKFNSKALRSIEQMQSQLDRLHRAREQHARLVAGDPLTRIPASIAASLLRQRPQEPFVSLYPPGALVRSNEGDKFKCAETTERDNEGEISQKTKEKTPKKKSVTSSRGMRSLKTSFLTSITPATNSVSKRKTGASKSVSEPLDLSHPDREVTTTTVLHLDDNNTNMLLEDKMNTEVDNDKAKTKEYVAEQADLHSKIKKEVVSDDPDSVTQGNTSPPTMHYPTLITQAEYPTFPKYTSQNLRESFVPFVNPWLNFQGAIINPNAFLTQAAYGYIPTALGNSAAAQLQPTLPPFDPNGISQRNHFAAGISQWVNLSLDVARAAERLRQPRIDEESADSMNSRKRKATDDIENHRSPAKESESDNLSFSRQSAENGKRFRSHNSTAVHSEGLHRSASDDPGNSREKDEQLSSNRTLKRRNSAPSTGVAPQVLEKEDDRRVAPVDLHSYAGCLPPHCLHLLQSSGNLALSYREHALKEVEEVYQTRNHGVPITANGNTSPQSELRIQHHTNNASNGDTKTIELTRIRESDFHMAGRRPSSTLYRELWRPSGRDEGSDSAKNKTIPLHPKATYLHGSHKPESWSSYRRKLQNSSVLSYNERRRSGDKARRASETESDDEDYIQTLQISDASSDDEEYSETIANPCSDARSQGSINFGRGAWSDLDLGNLPAFGGNVAVPILNTVPRQHSTSMYATIPTKMACSVIKNVPKTLNGLPRTYTSTKLGNPTKKSVDHKAYAYEFSPHDVIREPRKELQLNDLPLTQRSTTRETKSHKCRGCSHKRASQDESRLKLIGNILQQSYSKTTYGGFQSTTPHCAPRLVFTSEIKLPSEVQHRKVFSNSEEKPAKSSGLTASAAIEERSLQRTTTTSRNSDSEYSHKLFKFARAVKENKNREPKSVGEKDSIKSSSATENRASILSGSSVLAARTGRSTSSSSTRLNSLDAKLEELRQKATEREEMNKLDRQEREAAHSEAKPVNIKTETTYSHSSTDVTSPSCSQTNVIFDAKRKLSQSPFQESESGRFSGKKNVAVIKPNQSIVSQTSRDNIPFNVGPPKKRHMKRYSPEFYKQRREVILQDREVRSASPLPQEPFVSTNVLIDNEDRSLNVRWCSPDRSPTRRKHAQNARTILTYTVPLGPLKQSRGSNSHTVRLEQNYRKHPRYASSPRSDTVIVVESRVQETLRDEIDERLEIGDLEISDDES
ncbi:uncharacterized protein LOC120325934 isoform X2 [Styela clava]